MPTPDIIEVLVDAPIAIVEVEVPGQPGGKGEKGDPGIIVSATEPVSPSENDLWVDVS